MHYARGFSSDRITRIAQLNDTLRRTLRGGRILFTRGVTAFSPFICSRIIAVLGEFNEFRRDTDDPFGKHDFVAF